MRVDRYSKAIVSTLANNWRPEWVARLRSTSPTAKCSRWGGRPLSLNEQMLAAGEGQSEPAQVQEVAPSDADLTDVEKLQAAIEAGVDPTTAGEATAAGPGAGGGGAGGGAGSGHGFVLLGEVGGALDPLIGFPPPELVRSFRMRSR